MVPSPPEYEPRYLAGIVLFNRHDYFDAHEVWEGLWLDASVGTDRRFVQGLIQAAVALHHFANRNLRGASKLFASSRDYMSAYASPHLGLNIEKFWHEMDDCFANLNSARDPSETVNMVPSLRPQITLDPAPAAWPDPEPFLEEDA